MTDDIQATEICEVGEGVNVPVFELKVEVDAAWSARRRDCHIDDEVRARRRISTHPTDSTSSTNNKEAEMVSSHTYLMIHTDLIDSLQTYRTCGVCSSKPAAMPKRAPTQEMLYVCIL